MIANQTIASDILLCDDIDDTEVLDYQYDGRIPNNAISLTSKLNDNENRLQAVESKINASNSPAIQSVSGNVKYNNKIWLIPVGKSTEYYDSRVMINTTGVNGLCVRIKGLWEDFDLSISHNTDIKNGSLDYWYSINNGLIQIAVYSMQGYIYLAVFGGSQFTTETTINAIVAGIGHYANEHINYDYSKLSFVPGYKPQKLEIINNSTF